MGGTRNFMWPTATTSSAALRAAGSIREEEGSVWKSDPCEK
jgi:hypothetical protein